MAQWIAHWTSRQGEEKPFKGCGFESHQSRGLFFPKLPVDGSREEVFVRPLLLLFFVGLLALVSQRFLPFSAPISVKTGSLWRNWLARSAVNRKDGGSSPPRDECVLVCLCCGSCQCENELYRCRSWKISEKYSPPLHQPSCQRVSEWEVLFATLLSLSLVV